MDRFNKVLGSLAMGALVAFPSLTLFSCLDEQAPECYYTFTGQTVADYLEDSPEMFSDFITILKRAEIWGELDTYGEYTCFAPTNDAIAAYLQQKQLSSLDELTKADCDTLTWTHLIKYTFYMVDQAEGSLPSVNMNDRFLALSYDSVVMEDGRYRLRYCINKNAHIISLDDTVQNGVVQVVDSVIRVAGDYIYDVIQLNHDISIFATALNKVGLEDSLKEWKDETYHISSDSVDQGISGWGGGTEYHVNYWGSRKTNFTVFVEPNSVLEKHRIGDWIELRDYAKSVYDPNREDSLNGRWIDDETDPLGYRNRQHPLNKFISYHILPFAVPTSADFNPRNDIIESRCIKEYIDPEDYFEAYLPHSIMRISTVVDGANAGVYINRRGIGSDKQEFEGVENYRGVKIIGADGMRGIDNEGCNGYYHYIDDILVYSDFIRKDVLNRRLRIDCCTLSPDFMTSGARQLSKGMNVGFKQPKNFHSYNDDYIMWVRSAVTTNWSYQGDGLDFYGGFFDLYMKLPPVPFDGTWEFRLSYRGFENCGVVQNFIGDSPYNLQPCGIPTDLRLGADTNPNIGWRADATLSDEGGDEAILALDKSMHNRGYMKGPDSHTNGTDAFRDLSTMARRIVVTQYFYADKDYYLRLKMVDADTDKPEMNFDYMEWCPKSVYDNNEDKH